MIENNGLIPVMKNCPIRAGRHRLILTQRREQEIGRLTVAEDGTEKPVTKARKTAAFNKPMSYSLSIGRALVRLGDGTVGGRAMEFMLPKKTKSENWPL